MKFLCLSALLSLSFSFLLCEGAYELRPPNITLPNALALYSRYVSLFRPERADEINTLSLSVSLSPLLENDRLTRFLHVLSTIYAHNVNRTRSFSLRVNRFADLLEDELRDIFPSLSPSLSSSSSTSHTHARALYSTAPMNAPSVQAMLSLDVDSLWRIVTDSEEDSSESETVRETVSESVSESVSAGLNWASAQNPLSSPLTSAIYDQGGCGACWAFVTVSLTEAAVKKTLLLDHKREKESEGLLLRREETSRPPVSVPSLSAQQLLDCDTKVNRGCKGGNPYHAMRFVAEKGLTTSEKYPFRPQVGVCKDTSPATDRPRYFISHVVEITPHSDQAILDALRDGPVSVGLCGTDSTFLFYSRGVYNDAECCETQNHALLIVGHGKDAATDVKYWIAQNSWGTRWGEKGFVKIMRNSNSADGICGINVEPTQGLGGYALGAEGVVVGEQPTELERLVSRIELWLSDNWKTVAIALGMLMMLLSFLMLLHSFCIQFFGCCCWGRRYGYQPIPF